MTYCVILDFFSLIKSVGFFLVLLLKSKRIVSPSLLSVLESASHTCMLVLCPEEGHASLVPPWPAGGQREPLYKS